MRNNMTDQCNNVLSGTIFPSYRRLELISDSTKSVILTLVNEVIVFANLIYSSCVIKEYIDKLLANGCIVGIYSLSKNLNLDLIQEAVKINKVDNYTINGNGITASYEDGCIVINEYFPEEEENGSITPVFTWKINRFYSAQTCRKINKEDLRSGTYCVWSVGNSTYLRRKPDCMDISTFVRMLIVNWNTKRYRSTILFISDNNVYST